MNKVNTYNINKAKHEIHNNTNIRQHSNIETISNNNKPHTNNSNIVGKIHPTNCKQETEKNNIKNSHNVQSRNGYNIITHQKVNHDDNRLKNRIIKSGHVNSNSTIKNINQSALNLNMNTLNMNVIYPNINKNKPHTGQIGKNLDNLFMSYKNAPLGTPINLNNSLDTRINYSHSLQHKGKNIHLNGHHHTNNLNKINPNYKIFNTEVHKGLKEDLDINSYTNSYINSTVPTKANTKNISSNAAVFNAAAKSVKEYSYKEEKNAVFRNTMEDFCKIFDKFNNDPGKGLFTLYDGHGGSEPVKFVKDRMPEVFAKFLKDSNNNVEKAFIFAFQKIDDELKVLSESENAGTTACVIYITKENDIIAGSKRILYSANVGDTRSILISENKVKRLSYDHKCSDEAEANRIRKSGGVVFNGRMFGQLALSRALGDLAMKKHGIIPTPCVNKHTVSERDKYVVMCSDGVWDVLTDDEIFVISISLHNANADELASTIVKKAVDNGSRDNISCIAIKLN